MLARFTYWYLRHPMWGRPLALMIMLYWLASVTVALAPPAFASTNAEALNWTGVKDNQGVPLGNYYLASIDIYQAAKDSAPDVSWNPSTWLDWLGSMGSTMGGGALASVILTAEAGLFVGMLAISVWLFRLAAKSVWLTFFATLARPFVDAIFIVTAKAGMLLWLLPIAVFAGGWVAMIKGAGARGWMMILSAFLVAILGIALMSDPVTLMYASTACWPPPAAPRLRWPKPPSTTAHRAANPWAAPHRWTCSPAISSPPSPAARFSCGSTAMSWTATATPRGPPR